MGLSYEQISGLQAQYGTPFYIFDKNRFLDNYREIHAAFSARYENFIIGYSYKTNYLPFACHLVRQAGGYAEVVSGMEYELALKIGQDPRKIIFNGPLKTRNELEEALRNKSLVNLDSWREVGWVRELAERYSSDVLRVGLRINIDLADEEGVSQVQQNLKNGRFGFPDDAEGIGKVLELLNRHDNVRVVSLHGHTSSSTRSTWVYETITRTLCEIVLKYGLNDVAYIDVGGGIFGKVPPQMGWRGVPAFEDYARAICHTLKSFQWVADRQPFLVLEPGVAMASDALEFYTEIIDVKKIQNQYIAVVDGSAFNIKPSLHHINQPYVVLRKEERGFENNYHVVGSTCMEKDYLLENIDAKEIKAGDFISISNVGAYSIVLNPPFIHPYPPILTENNKKYTLVRNRQTFEDIFDNYSSDFEEY